jgi:hypothetical protein
MWNVWLIPPGSSRFLMSFTLLFIQRQCVIDAKYPGYPIPALNYVYAYYRAMRTVCKSVYPCQKTLFNKLADFINLGIVFMTFEVITIP